MNTQLSLCAQVALALLASVAPLAAQTAVPASAKLAPDEIAARGQGTSISFDELDAVLMLRHAHSDTGKQALQHLLEAGILPVLARESGLEITDAEVEARWQEIDVEIRGSGQAAGLAGYLIQTKVDPQTFRDHLRLSIVHETLARRGLGIPDSREISGEQLQNWMNATLNERKLVAMPPPWTEGIIARCAGLEVSVDELIGQLRKDLADDDLKDTCFQILLEKRVAARMPDLSEGAKTAALEAEISRRRLQAAQNPEFRGVPYEQILAARGADITKLHLDPAIRIAAWAHVWVDRKFDDDALRTAYQEDRARYDQAFGEAIETWVHFLRAAEVKTAGIPRTFEEAMASAKALRKNITSLPQFQYEIKRSSEHGATREEAGFWGWITSGALAYDQAAREEIFDALRSGRYDPTSEPGDAKARLLGPVRATSGVVLLWLGRRRPAPTWDEMKSHVHNELRRAFLEEVLPKNAVRTWRDE